MLGRVSPRVARTAIPADHSLVPERGRGKVNEREEIVRMRSPPGILIDGPDFQGNQVTSPAWEGQRLQTPSLRLPDAPAAAEGEETHYLPATTEHLLPPPGFKPFFTLVEDADTGEHHHPTVHYLFCDDEDQDLLTSAAIDAIQANEAASGRESAHDTEQRILLVDIEGDGRSVAGVSSMSRNWQAARTEIGQAPSWGDSAEEAEKGLMLKIIGENGRSNARRDTQPHGGLVELVETFGRQLESLREVLSDDVGDDGARALLGSQTLDKAD